MYSKLWNETTDLEITKMKIKKKPYRSLFQLRQAADETEQSHLKVHVERPVTEEATSPTIETWYQSLLKNIKVVSALPKVTETSLQDANRLFGATFDTKVTLRKARNIGANEEIIIVQFDPNFMSTDVVCRDPSCNARNTETAKRGFKRDLYLCPHHQRVLRNSISDTLAKKNVHNPTSTEKPEKGCFTGYRSLISLLEGAYNDAIKFGMLNGKPTMIEEAILNVRNFLIITSTLLNPNDDNLGIALPYVLYILLQILLLEESNAAGTLIVDLVDALEEIIEMILQAFGVIYRYVRPALRSPGAKIGAGVGGFAGGAAGLFFGPWVGYGGVAVGMVLGGLIGDGIYDLVTGDPRQQAIERYRRERAAAGGIEANGEPNNQYPVYYFEGSHIGDLNLHVFPAAQ